MLARIASLAVVAACSKEAPPAPPPVAPRAAATPSPAQQRLVKRGEYVVALSGCAVCHTQMIDGAWDWTRRLAGGFTEKLNGVWRSPNITADRATGIGAWSDREIAVAIRRGLRPDGRQLVPIMPYPYFHGMTDGDVRAVIAYLRAQEPIEHHVPPNTNLMIEPVVLPEPTDNVDPVDDPVAHGAYLARLMHCGSCHTPRSGPQANVPFVGGTSFLLSDGRMTMSPNITNDPDTGIGRWTEDQIITTIRTMVRPDGKPIEGPMALYAEAWAKLTPADARALAAYIRSIPGVRNDVPDRRQAVAP